MLTNPQPGQRVRANRHIRTSTNCCLPGEELELIEYDSSQEFYPYTVRRMGVGEALLRARLEELDPIEEEPQAPQPDPGALVWEEGEDDDGNTLWEADSAFLDGEGGPPFRWELRQALYDNRIVWMDCSDQELTDGEHPTWPTLEEAKRACQDADDNIRAELFFADREED